MGDQSVVYRSKENSDSREWSAVMNAAKMSGRSGTFYLKMSIRFRGEEVFEQPHWIFLKGEKYSIWRLNI